MLLYIYAYCMCAIIYFSFFFFKQKTAYEMRISDWSSDVCSSDLGCHLRVERFQLLALLVGQEMVGQFRLLPRSSVSPMDRHFCQEIGRASCRERVCQYV